MSAISGDLDATLMAASGEVEMNPEHSDECARAACGVNLAPPPASENVN